MYRPVSLLKEIFLSYSSKDESIAKAVKRELESQGWTAFLSGEDIMPSQDWEATLQKNLKECLALIVIATSNIGSSPWVNQEIEFALGQGKPVISIILGGSEELPAFLKSIQGINAVPERLGAAVQRALEALTMREDVVLERADVRSIMARRSTTDLSKYMTMARLEVYASLHEICDNILSGAPRPGQMLALLHEGRVYDLTDEEQRCNLWYKGTSLPAIRVSDAQLREIEDLVKTRRHLLQDSTVNAWHQVLRKFVYGFSLVQHDLEMQSFKLFAEDIETQFTGLRKETFG